MSDQQLHAHNMAADAEHHTNEGQQNSDKPILHKHLFLSNETFPRCLPSSLLLTPRQQEIYHITIPKPVTERNMKQPWMV